MRFVLSSNNNAYMGECDDFKGLCTVIRSSVEAVRRGALVALEMDIARGPLHGCDSRTRHMNGSTGSPRSHRGIKYERCRNESYDIP